MATTETNRAVAQYRKLLKLDRKMSEAVVELQRLMSLKGFDFNDYAKLTLEIDKALSTVATSTPQDSTSQGGRRWRRKRQ